MDVGHFYFLTDQYFFDFPDNNLMKNKHPSYGGKHNRPCFYSFQDDKQQIFWVIPISSKINKYKSIYNDKIKKFGTCDTLAFGRIMGFERAFLIQNMCPVTKKYVENVYIDSNNNLPVRIDGASEKKIIKKSKKVLALHRQGIKLIFPDVIYIQTELINQISNSKIK